MGSIFNINSIDSIKEDFKCKYKLSFITIYKSFNFTILRHNINYNNLINVELIEKTKYINST